MEGWILGTIVSSAASSHSRIAYSSSGMFPDKVALVAKAEIIPRSRFDPFLLWSTGWCVWIKVDASWVAVEVLPLVPEIQMMSF